MINIHLFGKLDIFCDGEHLSRLETHKVEELLCYLLLNRGRIISREAVADLLWGDINPVKSKDYLRKSLWQLQSSLDCYEKSDQERFILADQDWVQLNSEVELWLDVEVIEHTYSGVKGRAGRELFDNQVGKLKQAVELYRGDLLEGWYQDWCLYERERLKYIFIALLDKLMDFHEAHGEPELGLEYGNVILRYDRARERTHRRMMLLYYNAGDRTAGLRQYERCSTALREELDVEPAKRTLQFYELIRADRMDEVNSASRLPQPSSGREDGSDLLEGVSGNLIQIQKMLIGLQNKLENELNQIQRLLKSKH